MTNIVYPVYNPSIHKCGDMVLVKLNNKLLRAMVLDDTGYVFLNPEMPHGIVKLEVKPLDRGIDAIK